MANAKLIATVEAFEIYKAGHVVIIQENGEFFCNLRKADRGFADPAAFVESIVASRAEAQGEWAAISNERKERLEAYLSARRDRVEASPQFAF